MPSIGKGGHTHAADDKKKKIAVSDNATAKIEHDER